MNDQYMRFALEEAVRAKSLGDLPFGAVIVCNDKIVGKGRAENNSGGDVTAHAELQALREACQTLKRNNLNDCTMYCTNEPCPMCSAGIFQAKIATVVMGATRADLLTLLRPREIGIDELARDSGYEITLSKGVLKSEVLNLFRDITKP